MAKLLASYVTMQLEHAGHHVDDQWNLADTNYTKAAQISRMLNVNDRPEIFKVAIMST